MRFAAVVQALCAKASTTPLDFSFSSSSHWRIINEAQVTYGWSIAEVKAFADADCNSPLEPKEATSYADSELAANRSIDGLSLTEWRAPCHLCQPREAWLALHFDVPVTVMCLELLQWGERHYAAEMVVLQRREAEEWVDVLRGQDLQGGRWQSLHFVQCDELEAPRFGGVALTNRGLYPSEATFSCKGIRPMTGSSTSTCSKEGKWSNPPPLCWEAIHFIAAGSAVLFFDVGAFVLYYRYFMGQKPQPLDDESILPPDDVGRWNSELVGGCTAEPKSLGLVVLCPCCRLADTWQQAGIIGFQFGLCLPHFFFCCLPCIGGYFRNIMRRRFNIRRSSATLDCMTWSFLPWCAAVQEAKMVDAMCVVAQDEAHAKEVVDKRKAEAAAKAKAPRARQAPGAATIGTTRLNLSTKNGALRKPKAALEMTPSAV